jgi:Fur family transcriptional regulator, ferric uptake regulator
MSESVAQAQIDFEHFLLEKGLRLTAQRRKIVALALAQPSSFTADELLMAAQRVDGRVARATVFRTLKLMAEAGVLKAVDAGGAGVAYLASFSRKTTLAELICTDCGRISTLEAPFMEWYGRAAAQKCGLEAVDARVQIRGECLHRRQGKCPHQAR